MARQQIASPRGKARANFLLAVDDIRRRGCAAAGVRLAGEELSSICRRDFYAEWRLLTVFEAADRCVLLLVAQHTRSEDPYGLVYEVLGISKPEEPRIKPACCDSGGQPPVEVELVLRFEKGLGDLSRGLAAPGKVGRNRRR